MEVSKMHIMQHPVFRRFWYPTLAVMDLQTGPKPFTLLGENVVLWMQGDGTPAALEDRCPHRRAKLSVASYVVDGALQCGYHGWRFNGAGRCLLVPQMPELVPGAKHHVKRYQCKERYGFVWVCLDEEPLLDIPYIRHSDDPSFRQVFEYAEDWKANMLVVCENALDMGHISFVHRATFGNDQKPAAPRLTLVPIDNGVNFKCTVPVANHELQRKNLKITDGETVRTVDIRWMMPATFVLHFTYPTGLVHEICGFATPIDDKTIRRIQFVYRSDTEDDAPAEQIAKFDRSVAAEDRRMLESCDGNFVLSPVLLAHMMLDRPGLVMRRVLSELITKHDPNADIIASELVSAKAELEGVA
jgi:phenylpropionate dioxygenase-like ring-hydroxylating dioxygenase large terminal subunit